MPALNQHLPLAESNEGFAESIAELPNRFPDWEITVLFYSALHYADAFLATQDIHPRSHDSRIRSIRSLISVWEDYRDLYQLSLDARYNAVSFTAESADAVRSGSFRRVKDEVYSLLRNRT